MTERNSFFKIDDNHNPVLRVGEWEFNLPVGWWSRAYEYNWAAQHAMNRDGQHAMSGDGLYVADMGAGYTYRPFKDLLAMHGNKVAAIDANEKIFDTPHVENVKHHVSTFENLVENFGEETFDKIFCISVLEDSGNKVEALRSFKKVLKPGGQIILTFDSPHNDDLPCNHYPGVTMEEFFRIADETELSFGEVDMSRENAVFHEQFNLCVFHIVLTK